MNLKFRKFKKGDERKVSNVCRRCITEINSRELTKEQTEFMIDELSPTKILELSKEVDIYIVLTGEKVLGTAALTKNQVRNVFVNPDYHGFKIGTGLMNYVEKVARRRKHGTTTLNAHTNAVKFYKKLGYRKIRTIVNYAGEMVVMKKKLF